MQGIAFQHNMGWKGKDKEKSIYILHQNEISDDCQWSKSWLQQNFMSPPEKEVSGKDTTCRSCLQSTNTFHLYLPFSYRNKR